MLISFGYILAIILVVMTIMGAIAAPAPQCSTDLSVTSQDGLSFYTLPAKNVINSFEFNNQNTPTTLQLLLCDPRQCRSQCAVQTITADNESTCFGNCDPSATIIGLNGFMGLNLQYSSGSFNATVLLTCNPGLNKDKMFITNVKQNEGLLSIVGQAYCSSKPMPYTVTQTSFGQGTKCANWNIFNTETFYNATCNGGCTGSSGGSVLTTCWENRFRF